MRQLIQKGKAGSALVEVVLAIAILGLVSAPICSTLMVAARINAQSRAVMKAQTQVSSAVERLMAEGIQEEEGTDDKGVPTGEMVAIDPKLPGVTVTSGSEKEKGVYHEVVVTSQDGLVSVETIVKVKPAEVTPPAGGGGST